MYELKDEQIKLIYSKLKSQSNRLDATSASFHEEVALLMSYINTFLNRDIEDISQIDMQRMQMIMKMIELKAKLIREQRQQLEREQKAEERKAKLESISLTAFKNAISKVGHLLLEYVPMKDFSKLMVKLDEIIAEVETST